MERTGAALTRRLDLLRRGLATERMALEQAGFEGVDGAGDGARPVDALCLGGPGAAGHGPHLEGRLPKGCGEHL